MIAMTTKTLRASLALSILLASLLAPPLAGAHHGPASDADGNANLSVRLLELDYATPVTSIEGYGDVVVVEVQDIDRTSATTLTVSVGSTSAASQETVTLRRHTPDTGVPAVMRDSFFGFLSFEDAPAAGNGRVYAVDGDTITASYVPASGSTYTAQAAFARTATGVLSLDGASFFGFGAPGDACSAPQGAKITVNDADGNQLAGTAETLSVEVRSSRAPNTAITVLLLETGSDTGVFEGRVCFTSGTANDASDRIQVREGAVVTVKYQDAQARAGTSLDHFATLVWREATDGVPQFYPLNFNGTAIAAGGTVSGDTAFVRLFDHDRDTSSSQDTVTVVVQSLAGATLKGQLTLVLEETGANTGEFIGTVGLATAPTAGKLVVASGDTLRITYIDQRTAGGAATVTVMRDAIWRPLVDGSIRLVRSDFLSDASDYYGIGAASELLGKLYIRVEDADRAGQGPLKVAVSSTLDTTGRVEVTLTETGANTGIFTGAVPFVTGLATKTDAILVQEGSTVAVFYDDVAANGRTRLLADTALWHMAETGTLTFDQPSYTGISTKTDGDRVTIVVADADRNLASGSKDKVTVRVASPSLGVPSTQVFVDLEEVEENSGIFRGTFGITTGVNNDGSDLLRLTGTTFQARYSDPANAAGSPVDVDTATTPWTDSTLVGAARLDSGKYFGTAVKANLLYFNSAAAPVGGFKVCATSPTDTADADPDGVEISLTETSAGSKVYKGSVGFTTGASSTTNLKVASGDTVTFLEGACPGAAFASPVTATWSAFTAATPLPGPASSNDPAEFTVGLNGDAVASPQREFGFASPAFLRVVDADGNRDTDLRDVLEVTVGDETIGLLETGLDTGVFVRGPVLFDPTAASNNGRIGGPSGGTFTLKYTDSRTPSGTAFDHTDTLQWFAAGAIRFAASAGGAATQSFVGERTVHVELTDAFYNTDAATSQQVLVTVLTEPTTPVVGDGGSGDSETVTLTETGPNTGVFRGSVPLVHGTDVAGRLLVGGGDDPSTDTLTARVIKDRPAGAPTGDGDVVQTSAAWTAGSTGQVLFTSESPLPDTPAVAYPALAGGQYVGQSSGFLQLFDADINRDPQVSESVDVKVFSQSDPTTGITVTLRETLANSGIFRGRFSFTLGASSDSADAIKVADNDALTASYTDDKRDDGQSGAVGASNAVNWQETNTGSLAADKRKVSGTDSVVLTLTDKDLDTTALREQLAGTTVALSRFAQPLPRDTTPVTSTQVDPITFEETGPETGVFQAILSFASSDTGAPNQVITDAGVQGMRIVVSYVDSVDALGQEARGREVEFFWYPTNNGFVLFDAIAYPNLGDTATISVFDPSPSCTALSSTAVETLLVHVVSSSDGRGESVSLTETGVNSRLFRGTVGFEAGLSSGNGKVGVASGDHVTVLHYDANRDSSVAPSTTCAGSTSPVFVDRDVARFGVSATNTPTASLAVEPTSGTAAPLDVSFMASGTDGDGLIVAYSLNFGDSTTPMTGTTLPALVPHTYTESGTYTAILTVTDNSGLTASANATVTVGETSTTTTTTSSTTTTTTTTSSSTTTTGPGGITAQDIEDANKDIDIDVERVGDDNLISFDLPSNLPGDPAGVQIWRSTSPFVLVKTLDDSDADFIDGDYLDVDAPADAKYLVTVYYGLTSALGYSSTGSSDQVPGFDALGAGVSSVGSNGVPLWVWILVAAIVLVLIVVVIVLILRRRNAGAAPRAQEEGYAWDEGGMQDGGEDDKPQDVGPSHQCRCPACKTQFSVNGTKPITTICPGCGKKGILR